MATISAFRKALHSPIEHFRTIPNIWWDDSPVRRSTYFAECHATLNGCPTMIFMPLTSVSLHRAERLCTLKKHLAHDIAPQLTILRNEMRYDFAAGESRYCDILLEPSYRGMPFTTALATAASDAEFAGMLLSALDKLQHSLQQADLSLNNLREENLILDDSLRLRPIRWYYATQGVGGDAEQFDALRTKIAALSCDMVLREADTAPYEVASYDLSPYLNHLDMTEGLIAVESAAGWGFINSDGDIVIEPGYSWVSQFFEGRAEVETPEGMGLIDKSGQYIIPPLYNIVDYDHITGRSLVNRDDSWAIFDYAGNIITPFGTTKPEF